MHLDSALMLAEFCPLEHRQAKVDGGGVEGIDMTVKLEDFLYSPPAGFRNHGECELLEDAVVALLVGFAKIATCHGLPDSEMIEFPGMSLHCNDKIPKALSVGELPEHHRK